MQHFQLVVSTAYLIYNRFRKGGLMHLLISPTKTMQAYSAGRSVPTSELYLPILLQCQKLTLNQIKKFYKCNDSIAEKTLQNFQNYSLRYTAIYAYSGLQYKYLNIQTLSDTAKEYLYANTSILSALHGRDNIGEYRLDFSIPICIEKDSLYTYWQKQNIWNFDEQYVSLASEEYFKMLPGALPVVQVLFYVLKNGKYLQQATVSKMTRGLFLRECALQNIQKIEELYKITVNGFSFSQEKSNTQKLIFVKETT